MTLAKIIFLRIFHLLMSKTCKGKKKLFTLNSVLLSDLNGSSTSVVLSVSAMYAFALLLRLLLTWLENFFCQAFLSFSAKKGIPSLPRIVLTLCLCVLTTILLATFFAYDSNYKTRSGNAEKHFREIWGRKSTPHPPPSFRWPRTQALVNVR